MTYNEAIKRLEQIVQLMENSEAMSIDEYRRSAAEAKQLIDFCQKQLTGMEKEMTDALSDK